MKKTNEEAPPVSLVRFHLQNSGAPAADIVEAVNVLLGVRDALSNEAIAELTQLRDAARGLREAAPPATPAVVWTDADRAVHKKGWSGRFEMTGIVDAPYRVLIVNERQRLVLDRHAASENQARALIEYHLGAGALT